MDYVHSNPNVTIIYHAKDMYLLTDSDAVYFVQPWARSCIASHFYLSNKISASGKPDLPSNGPILMECRTVQNVMSSMAEAEK